MKRAAVIVVLVAVAASLALRPLPAAADGLSIGPLKYQTTLKPGQTKKGFVDIQNQSASSVEVHLKAQAFKQINDQGGLQFYDSEAVSAGVKLDLDDITIPPRAGAHVYFLLDGTKLPSGDVFAAILASTTGKEHAVTVPSVQVGTLLLVENGTPPSHNAQIGSLEMPWLQIGNSLSARFRVKNTDPPQKLTGFEPSLTVATWPYGTKHVKGPLVFAGRSRAVTYTQPGNYFGPLLLKVQTGSSEQSGLIFAVTGYWRWLAPLIVVLLLGVIGLGCVIIRRRKTAEKPGATT